MKGCLELLPTNIKEYSPEGSRRSSVGEGWVPIVEELHNILVKVDSRYRIDQVKEKFGGLRYYFTPSFVPKNEPQRYSSMRYLVELAEALAARTCAACGRDGEVRNLGGWIVPRCDDCFVNETSGPSGDVSVAS